MLILSDVDDDDDDEEVEAEEGYEDLIKDDQFFNEEGGPSARDINDRMRRQEVFEYDRKTYFIILSC